MSLILRVSLCSGEDCKSFSVFDATGLYASNTNAGGYGTINPEITDVTIASIVITAPDGTVYTNTSVIGDQPSLEDALVTITNEDFGYDADTPFEDGLYTITYSIDDNSAIPVGGASYTVTEKVLITCVVEKCIDRKVLEIKGVDCDCETQDIDALMRAYLLLQGAQWAAGCGEYTTALNKLETLQEFCDYTNCKNCN